MFIIIYNVIINVYNNSIQYIYFVSMFTYTINYSIKLNISNYTPITATVNTYSTIGLMVEYRYN